MLGFVIIVSLGHAHGAVHVNIPELNREVMENETRLHLKEARVQRYCRSESRLSVCTGRDSVVCAARRRGGRLAYRQFDNACFLFIANMCDYPGEEFNIVSSSTCAEYLRSRRHGGAPRSGNVTYSNGNSTSSKGTTSAPARWNLRAGTTMSTIYDIDTAFDYHPCPLSCPDTYQPVCVCANRNWGLYYKFFSFVNHCEGDRYYCKHWQEFSPPPDEDEKVQSSYLGWSYCGSSRYLMFSRFAEASASLGHYGWLHGNYRYSHIMEPNERQPGFG